MRLRMWARVAVAQSTLQVVPLVTKHLTDLVSQAPGSRRPVMLPATLIFEVASCQRGLSAGGGTRTRTRSPAMDFESISAANFDTPACLEL